MERGIAWRVGGLYTVWGKRVRFRGADSGSASTFLGETLAGEGWFDRGGEASAKVVGIGGTGTCDPLLESDWSTNRMAFGVAGSPILGPRLAYMLRLAPGSTVWLLVGRSFAGTNVVFGSSKKAWGDVLFVVGNNSSGCGIGGAEGRRASDLRRSSSSRAAASFFACRSSFIAFRSPAWAGAGAGAGAGVVLGVTCDGIATRCLVSPRRCRLSDLSRTLSRTEPGEAGSRALRLVLRTFLRRNFSFASIALLRSSSSSDP